MKKNENAPIRRDVNVFDGDKIFVPKGFQVAERVDGPQVKLLKSIKSSLFRRLNNYENYQKIDIQNGISQCIEVIDKRIEKIKKIEGTFIKIPKAK